MNICYYEDNPLAKDSIFLAGPTTRKDEAVRWEPGTATQWRRNAVGLLRSKGFEGNVLIPEFNHRGQYVYKSGLLSPVEHMDALSFSILRWETWGIDYCSVLMFWMPFDRTTAPGLTTRSEVARAINRHMYDEPEHVVLGMPPETRTVGFIRYHAWKSGFTIHPTLEATVDAALEVFNGK